jgi:hypothetical protein
LSDLPSLKHCGVWSLPTQAYDLFSPKGTRLYYKQQALLYVCQGECKNVLYRRRDFRKEDGKPTGLKRISPQDWRNEWLARLETDLITDPEALEYKTIDQKAGVASKRFKKAADQTLSYLRSKPKASPMTKAEFLKAKKRAEKLSISVNQEFLKNGKQKNQ